MKADSIFFRIEKCQNSTLEEHTCKSDKEIQDFIEDLEVQMWMIESQID